MFSKNGKNKGNRKYKRSSHSTSNLKSKKPCDQSSVKAFLNKSLLENKGKLNMNTSESCAVVRSVSFNSVLSPKLLYSWNVSKDISVNKFEEPPNLFSVGKYKCSINYSETFVKTLILVIFQVLAYREKLIILHFLILNQIVKNPSSFSIKPNVIINSLIQLLIWFLPVQNLQMSLCQEKLYKLQCNVLGSGKYGKCNTNTSQQSTDTVQNFNSASSRVSDLLLSALGKSSDCYSFLL